MAGPMKPGAGLRGKDNTGRIMRRKNQAILGVISAAADAVLIFLSYLGAAAIRFDVLDGHVSLALNSPRFYAAAGVYALLIVCVYAACHLYQPFRRNRDATAGRGIRRIPAKAAWNLRRKTAER